MNSSVIVPVSTVIFLVVMERAIPFKHMRFFRRYFVTDVFYAITGFIAGGWLAVSYVSEMTDWVARLSANLDQRAILRQCVHRRSDEGPAAQAGL